jgi:hypothetical protein
MYCGLRNAVGPANPATDPHSGTRYSLPSHAPAVRAPSAQSVSRPTYRVLCRVYRNIPLRVSTFPILLSLCFSALPVCAKSTS